MSATPPPNAEVSGCGADSRPGTDPARAPGLPTQARAAVLEAFGQPVVLRDFPLPERLAQGEILVRTLMAGLCGTDVHLAAGQLGIPLPVILGHETVGEIVALGSSPMTDWTGQPLSLGARVTWHSSVSCGRCRACRDWRLPTRCAARRAYGVNRPCAVAPHLLGGYAQYHHLLADTAVFVIPQAVSTETVIGGGCAMVTAIAGAEVIGLGWGQRVVVQGAGPVGLAALAMALDSGARQTIVIGGPAHRLALARAFGADVTIDLAEMPDPADRLAEVRRLTGGAGADVVLECVGAPAAVCEGWPLCRDGGRYLVMGHYCDAGAVPLNPHVITRGALTVAGTWSSEPRHTELALDFYRRRSSRYDFAALVSHRFGLGQVNEALAATAVWSVTKSVVVPL